MAKEKIDVSTVNIADVDPKKLGKDEFADLLDAFDGTELDFARMDPQNFARIISRASKDQVETVMARPALRTRVLDEVFRRMEVHFRADRAGATKAVVHFHVLDDSYEAIIEDATCSINKDPSREPRASVTLTPADFLKLATGNASAPVLFMTGKLKVKGDLGFAAGFMSLFNIPKA